MKRVRLAPTTQSCGNHSLSSVHALRPRVRHMDNEVRLPHRNHHFANRAANEHRRGDQALRRFKRRVAPCPSTEAPSPPKHLALNIQPAQLETSSPFTTPTAFVAMATSNDDARCSVLSRTAHPRAMHRRATRASGAHVVPRTHALSASGNQYQRLKRIPGPKEALLMCPLKPITRRLKHSGTFPP
jgi:hypothetical protein